MIEIVIWVSPVDLDDLEKTFKRLLIGKEYLTKEQKSNIKFNVVMCISDEIINWSKTQISKEECIFKFLNLKELCTWATIDVFETTTTICGCTSMRTNSAKSNSDYYLWLDTDIVYQPEILPYMVNSIDLIKSQGFNKFIITPEIVRIWDDTWDCLVNKNFINKPLGYYKTHNPYEDAKIYGEVTIKEVICPIPNQPYMKFAGGWFTILSKELLQSTPFPENYGHYGLDDTYIMWYTKILNDSNIKQFKLENVVVCENYFDRIKTYGDKIKFIDRREEYKIYNEELFHKSLNKLYNKL
jgi:hypothetical protein